MGFEMDQETSGVFPVCRFVFQMNFDSCRMVEYCLETFSGLGQSVGRERKHEVNELGVGD